MTLSIFLKIVLKYMDEKGMVDDLKEKHKNKPKRKSAKNKGKTGNILS